MPTGSVIVGRASSSELSDHGMRCLVGDEGSVEVGVSTLVSTEIEYKTDSLVRISYMYRCCAGGSDKHHVRMILLDS